MSRPFIHGGYELPENFQRQDQQTHDLVREISLQSKPTDKGDADNVIDNVIAIYVGQSTLSPSHDNTKAGLVNLIHSVLVEWLNCGWRSLGKSLARDGLTQHIHDAQESPSKTAQRAWDVIWT